MAKETRYFWLRLYDDFFSSKRIKKLRKLAGGDTYLIIYLKMQLIAMKHEGILRWSGLDESFADELALEIDEEPDNIEVTVRYLLSCGLAETADNETFFIPYAVKNVGSESSSAKRMRESRARANLAEASQCAHNVQEISAHCDREKEIEKDIEKDIDIENNKTSSLRSEVFVAPEPAATPQPEPTKQIPYAKIQEIYNRLCTNMPKCTALSEMRRKAIRARFAAGYKLEDFEQMFSKAAQSSFLNGANDRNFMANFDWLIKDANMAKVLSGNYEDRAGNAYGRERTSGNIFMEMLREEEERQHGSI